MKKALSFVPPAADALDLIGGDGHANAGGAKDDALVALAVCHAAGSGSGKFGVVTGVGGIGAEVLHFKALALQMGNQLVLQRQSAMVTANCDFHNVFLLCVKL